MAGARWESFSSVWEELGLCTGTGHPVPVLGAVYRYPAWGTGTPLGRGLIFGWVPVPIRGYRYPKVWGVVFEGSVGFERGLFGKSTW